MSFVNYLKKHALFCFAGVGVVAAISASYLAIMIRQSTRQYDYIMHFQEAASLASGNPPRGPHMLFHVLTAFIDRLFSLGIISAGLLLLTICISITAVLLIIMFKRCQVPLWGALIAPFFILIVAPIALLYGFDKHLYFGYVGVNVYHNPTMLLLKPFMVGIFMLSPFFWCTADKKPAWLWCILPLFLVLSALSKPSFLIVYVPGLGMFLLIRYLLKKAVDWKLFLFAVFLPSTVVLGWQYWMTYSANQIAGLYAGKSSVAFAPLTVVAGMSKHIFVKLLLSVAFPLSILGALWRSAMRDEWLGLSWLIFLIGAFQFYFLIEQGPRALQGNFAWGAQAGAFVLFIASVRHLLTQTKNHTELFHSPAWVSCLMILILHVLAGFVFYAAEFHSPQGYW